jgi:O-antigen/teichoic acid export membrane protein
MAGSLINRLLKSGSVQGLHLVLTIGQNILLVPIWLNYWGVEEYGRYIACFSLFTLLMSLDNGFGNFFTNEYNIRFHKGRDNIEKMLSSSLRVVFLSNLIQIFIIFLIWMFQSVFVIQFFEDTVLLGVSILCFYRVLLGGSKGLLVRTLYPLGFFHRSSMIGLGEAFLDLLVLFVSVQCGVGFLKAIIFTALAKSVYALFSFYLISRWTGILLFKLKREGDLKTGLRYYKKSMPLMLNSFMDKGSNDGLNTIVGMTLGTSSLPIFTTVKTMASMVNRLINLLIEPLTPELGRFHSLDEKGKILDIFRLSWLATSVLVGIPVILFSLFSAEIYSYWLGGKLEFQPVLYVALMSATLMYSYGRPFIAYMTSINYMKGLSTISLLRGSGTMGLGVVFIYLWGMDGLGWSGVLTEILVSVFLPFVLVSKIWLPSHPFLVWREMWTNLLNLLLIVAALILAVLSDFRHGALLIITPLIALAWHQKGYLSVELRKRMADKLINFIPLLK